MKFWKFVKIILIVGLVGFILISISLPRANGENIRDEITSHKKDVISLEKNAISLTKEVDAQKKLIIKNEKLYETAKDDEKTARKNIGKSWTGVQEHNTALDKVEKTKDTWIKSKDDLMLLYKERSDVLKEIRSLEELIDKLDALPTPKGKFNIIGITLDNTCKIFIKNNFTSNCPTFELLNSFYPGSPCVTVAYSCISYYNQTGGFHYLIDPPSQVAERIKMVEIRYSIEEFHIQGEGGYDDINHTINYQVGRYLDGCKTAYIGSGSWLKYTGDSIYLLSNECNLNYTYLGGFRSESINQTVHNIADSYKWQLDKWIKESREKCRLLCFEY